MKEDFDRDDEIIDDLLGMEILGEHALLDEVEDDEDLQGLVQRAVEEAIQWREEHLDPEQEKATDYYMGRKFGDEKEGRSSIVATNVRDIVAAIMPSLLRIFFGSEKVVEFKPDHPDLEDEAEVKTAYVQHIVREDNPGFMAFYSAFKDALVRKMGVIKYWWEDEERVTGDTYTGLTDEQLDMLLASDPNVIDAEVEITPMYPEEELEGRPQTYDVTLRRRVRDGRVRLAAVPPEEFIFSPNARSLEEAQMVGHVRYLPADDIVAMGVDRDLVEEHMGGSDVGRRTGLRDARELDGGARRGFEDESDDTARPVRFADLYMRLDVDGDGITELRHVQAIGEQAEIVRNEPAAFRPFAVFGPDPEPHTMVGLSAADYVMDLQRINSQILRGMLDSLAQHLDPATEIVEGEVNMKDLLNPEPNRIVRVRRPGMMREVAAQFLGGSALPVLQWLQEVQENRVGITKAAAGLDADALQSSTKAAVAATLSASQQRIETIARIFAETGMRELFTGVLKLVVQNQDFERTIRIGGKWVTLDPREWRTTHYITVNVALGAGLTEEKLQTLSVIAEKQEQLLAQGIPLVTFREYRNTLSRMTELAGFSNAAEFWQEWDDARQAEYEEQQAAAAEQGDPATQALVEVEMAKIQARQEESMAKLQSDQQKTQIQVQADQQKTQAQTRANHMTKELETQLRLHEIALQDERERMRMLMDYEIRLAQIEETAATRELNAQVQAAKLDLQARKDAADREQKIAGLMKQMQDLKIEGVTAGLDVVDRLTSRPANESPE